ncbi:MAG: TIGR03862 family flavoprotein [Magnetovibrio sp.]|nr:TIGR03862 family flavoprotein [Magnetovibrio sp.]
MKTSLTKAQVAIIGGGPAGLMAAEVLCAQDVDVHLFDAMPSLGRKFLMAGKSGLNLTHGEAPDKFLSRFGTAQHHMESSLTNFSAKDIQAWARELGIKTFVGTSGRVFPKNHKAAPLLRAWVRRLRAEGLNVHVRHKWIGWDGDALQFETPDGPAFMKADATILALGGASWPKLGSDGAWVDPLSEQGIAIAPLRPANCGFDADWSDHIKTKFGGAPLKSVRLTFKDQIAKGDATITENGLESGPVYTLSAALRDEIEANGTAVLHIDLLPGLSEAKVIEALNRPRGKKTMGTHLKRTLKLTGAKVALLHEALDKGTFQNPVGLAQGIKTLPITLVRPRPIDEVISTAGGIEFGGLTDGFMLNAKPGVFCAGEMLDWEAPTGGYLLSACMATGRTAGEAVAQFLKD